MERHASPVRKSIDGKPEPSSNSRSSSLDRTPSSPSALADSALSSLRKSIASQRASNSGRTSKLSLEERLRATFAIGEPSSGSTPAVSSLPSPSVEPSEPPIDRPEVPEAPPAELHEAVTEKISEDHPDDVDSLQERLKLIEQRFNDVSMSFKQLQAEKDAADATLRELTSLQTIQDVDALRAFLQDTHLKSEMSQEEIKKLNVKIQTQEDRLEDLRDTHRLESSSQSEQIEQLRRRLSETETLLKASQDIVARGQGDSAQNKAETDRLNTEVEKLKALAKEEEEKRVKAISLLKTVRQKLVKAEKEKEEAVKELNSAKDRDKEGVEKEQAEKLKLMEEIETARAERERSLQALKIQFDKETVNLKDRHEKELSALKGQLELEALNAKTTYGKDSAAKASQISRLESSVETLSRDKNDFFEQLQIRQAEWESSQSHLESLQSLVTELQYQLRESQDRVALLNEELVELQREHESHQREPSNSSDKVAQLLSASNAKYESRLSDLKKTLATVETERAESEAEWSRKLREKVQEANQLRQVLSSAAKNKKEDEGLVDHLKAEVIRLQEEVDEQKGQVSKLKSQIDTVDVMQNSAKDQEVALNVQNTALKEEIEECKAREAQLRLNNKNLREELRKVQSSAALLERQRNPGVGYWTSRGNSSPSDAMPAAEIEQDEEVNLEYLRNVILQFLEHKEMRPNLVKVLSIILHFTPQETRRLIAKV